MEMHDMRYGARDRGPSAGLVVLLALIFGIVGGVGGTWLTFWANQQGYLAKGPMALNLPVQTSTLPNPLTPTVAPGSATTSSVRSFAEVASELEGSVVNINTQAVQQDPMSLFFGGNGQQVVKGLGTGIIVSEDGYILTNYHVVGEANNIKVTVIQPDGKKQYDAKLVGGDKQEDLAVVKVDAKGLHPVRWGNSDILKPGEWVMAMGNPFGFEHTVSVGVVSALNRELPVEDTVTLKRMIQTDASINPGNSGGPLVNMNGEVIGINSAVFVGGGNGQPQAKGIGFAIPSNRAQKIMALLRANKKVEHPYIGIQYEQITDEVSLRERLPVKSGVLVQSVYAKGPAAKGGLKPSDIIKGVDGQALTDRNTLGDYISNQTVGKTITLDIKRWNGNTSKWDDLKVRVKTENKPAEFETDMRQQGQVPENNTPEDGNNGSQQPNRLFPFGLPF